LLKETLLKLLRQVSEKPTWNPSRITPALMFDAGAAVLNAVKPFSLHTRTSQVLANALVVDIAPTRRWVIVKFCQLN
jgi:hypothetical protein